MSTVTHSISKLATALLIGLALAVPCFGQQPPAEDKKMSEIKGLGWQAGPSQGPIAGRATIKVPQGYVYLGAADTSKFLTLLENLPTKETYTFAPRSLAWFAVFNYSDTGHIKDDDKIDPDAILASLKEGTAEENIERKKLGYPALELEGWAVVPHYDDQTKRLEWATKLRSTDGISVNYSIRLLGRTGVMNATLVSGEKTLDADVRTFKSTLDGFSFNGGEQYAEFRSGDKIAEYGLTGLIIGGAAAVAAKAGLFKFLGKFAVYIFAGIAALFGGFVRWFKGRKTAT
jgi:uncharacterized membrane-anchored protein